MPGTVELLHVASDLWMSPLCPIRAGGGWYWYAVFSLRNTESHFPSIISFSDTSRSHNASFGACWKLKKSLRGNFLFARPSSHEKKLKTGPPIWGVVTEWMKAFTRQIRPGRIGRKDPRKKRRPNPQCTSVTPGWIFSQLRSSVGTFKNCISEQALCYRTSYPRPSSQIMFSCTTSLSFNIGTSL